MHSIKDKQPEVVKLNGVPLSALIIFHHADWSGMATIRWMSFKGPVEEVSIKAMWLLQGVIMTDHGRPIPLEVACRAVALAASDRAIRRVTETIESLNLLELGL